MPVELRISKPTKNALTATSPDDFYLHSNYPLLKVHSFGTFSFSISLGAVNINHNLGYKPYALVFSKIVDFDFDSFTPFVTSNEYQHDWIQQGATQEWWGYTKIYANKLRIAVGQTSAFHPVTQVTGFYYIFKDEVS